jgi:hypothetical protein
MTDRKEYLKQWRLNNKQKIKEYSLKYCEENKDKLKTDNAIYYKKNRDIILEKKKKDYSNTVIYKITCNDTSIKDCYVGHTVDFNQRKSHHKTNCNNDGCKSYTTKLYCFIRDNNGWENWTMSEVEKYSCSNLDEAKLREQYWVDNLNATLNVRQPLNKAYQALYFQNNKEKILKKRNETEKETSYQVWYHHGHKECVCGNIYKIGSIYQHRKICKVYKESLVVKPIDTTILNS